jgi:hypothetical protein
MPLECPLFGDPPAKGTDYKSSIAVRKTGYKRKISIYWKSIWLARDWCVRGGEQYTVNQ